MKISVKLKIGYTGLCYSMCASLILECCILVFAHLLLYTAEVSDATNCGKRTTNKGHNTELFVWKNMLVKHHFQIT